MPRPECRPERTRDHGRLRRRDRPGHDEHAVHDLRPRRRGGRPAPARAPADPAARRLGRARPGRDLGAHQRRRSADRAQRHRPARRATSPRSASPTSARPPWCGTAAPAGPTTTRSSGRTPAPTGSPAALDARRPRRRHPAPGRAAAGDLLLRPASSSGSSRTSTGVRAAAERGDALFGTIDTLAALEPHRRRRRRRARHRRHQRQPHHADGPARPWTGTTSCSRSSASRGRCCRRSARPRTRRRTASPAPTARAAARCRSPACSATSRRPWSGRSAWPPGEAKNTYGTGNFLLLNTGEELVRSEQRPADHGLLPVRRRAAGLRPGGLDRRHRLGRAVAARPARHHRGAAESEALARQVDGQRRRLLRARVLRPVRPVLALRRPRRHRRAVPVQHQRAPGPGHPRGDLLPEPRRGRGDGATTPASTSRCSRSTAA